MPVKYTKMIKDGSWELIQEDRVSRKLEEGWEIYQPETKKESPRKNSKEAITVDAQVTSESEEEPIEEDDGDWTYSLEDETANKEE